MMEKIPTPKEIRDILKRFTPEQRKAIQARVSDVFAKHRRSRFRLISHTQQEVVTARMNRLAREFAALKPNDPRRAEIVKEMSELSLLSAKGRTSDG
jgi:hypothetical protein